MIKRIVHRHVGKGPLTAGDIPDDERPNVAFDQTYWSDEHFDHPIRCALALGMGLKEIGAAAERSAVRIAMHEENGNLRRAAQRLGVTDRALQLRRAASREKPNSS